MKDKAYLSCPQTTISQLNFVKWFESLITSSNNFFFLKLYEAKVLIMKQRMQKERTLTRNEQQSMTT